MIAVKREVEDQATFLPILSHESNPEPYSVARIVNCHRLAIQHNRTALDGVRRIDVTGVGLTVHIEHGHSADEFAALAVASDDVQSVRVRAPDIVEVFQALTEPANG